MTRDPTLNMTTSLKQSVENKGSLVLQTQTKDGQIIEEEAGDDDKPKESELKQTWNLFKSTRMLKLLPLMMWSGISMGIYQAAIVPNMVIGMPSDWDDNKQDQMSTIAQIGLGVGEVIGGLANGEITDRLGTRTSWIINMV